MSFLRCCVGADPRPPPESIRPVAASNRRNHPNPTTSFHQHANPANHKKMKMPTEVFFDPTKPDGQLSSVTDPPNSTREYADSKKKKESKDKSAHSNKEPRKSTANDKKDLEAPDNNGLTRGQNFMKVEKWLRDACMHKPVGVTPGDITNIEDTPVAAADGAADPPSEKDRVPPATGSHQKSAIKPQ